MGAFGSVSALSIASQPQGLKQVVIDCVGPASYDTGGSVLNLSVAALGADAGFTTVYGVANLGRDTAAEDRYHSTYILAAAGAAATGVVKVRDLDTTGSGSTDGVIQVAGSADLSTVTFRFLVTGK